jgi:Tfp pilus assembly protein PilO
MTRTGPDRLWLIGGAGAAVVLLAVAWFFLISPQYAQAASLNDQSGQAAVRLNVLRHKLAELKRQNADLDKYQAQLAKDRHALPQASGIDDFLRELQAMGERTGVSVTGLAVGATTHVPAAGSDVFALPLTLNATGDIAKVTEFVRQLQLEQPRAVLVTSAGVVPPAQRPSIAGPVNLTLNLRIYVAPPAAADAKTSASAAKTSVSAAKPSVSAAKPGV